MVKMAKERRKACSKIPNAKNEQFSNTLYPFTRFKILICILIKSADGSSNLLCRSADATFIFAILGVPFLM